MVIAFLQRGPPRALRDTDGLAVPASDLTGSI